MSLLSICIPTYNRSDELKARLEEIVVQIYKYSIGADDLQIVISDNNSRDNTSVMISQLMSQHTNINIKFHKNKKNLGYGKNINELIKLSESKYIWLCGDDDYISDNAIYNILNILKTEEPEYIVLNSLNYDLKTNKYSKKNIIDDLKDGFFNSDQVLSEYFEIIVFIGSNVFSRKLALKALEKLNNEVSDVYQNSILSFLIIDSIQKVYISSLPYVSDKLGNKNYTIRQYIDVPILEYIKMKEMALPYNNKYFLRYLNKKIFKHIKFYFYKTLLWKIFRGIDVKDYYKEVFSKKEFLTIQSIFLIKLFMLLASLDNRLLKLLLFIVVKFNIKKYKKIKEEIILLEENKVTKYMEEK
jgi:glycosyltransferase involved in cell wall biosynthesis